MSGERFAPLRQLFRDERTLVRVLGTFGAATRADLHALETAHREGDLHGVSQVAHKLKSACAQMGETDTARALNALEDASLASTPGGALATLVADASTRLAALIASVEDYLAAHGRDDRH